MKGHIAKGELVVSVELIFEKTTIQEFLSIFKSLIHFLSKIVKKFF